MARRPTRYFSLHRVVGYTDAVFAIAATLLVLDLTTSAIGTVSSDQAMWAALAGMWQTFTAFAISFALLSMLWIIHLQQWTDIVRVDTPLLWFNNARLFFVVTIPFTTSLTADYSGFYAGRILLPVNFFLVALFGVLSWTWAASADGRLLSPDVKRSELTDQRLGGLSALICGAVTVIASPWAGSWAFLAYALNGPLKILLTRRARARHDEAATGS